MRVKFFLFVIVLQLFCFSKIQANNNCTLALKIQGVIGPATVDFLQRGIAEVKNQGCKQLLIELNTPGGSLQSTRIMVQDILSTSFPILCLISPNGAHAGSAGAILLQACHVSGGMSATNLGAATPIQSSGNDIAEDLKKKILNDTLSWMDSLTELRGRNKQFARDIVKEAKAVSIGKAVKLKAIDLEVKSITEFLNKSSGIKVKVKDDKTITLSEPGETIEFNRDLRFKILELTTDPQTAYLMFMGSLGLLYFEITHPGMVLPGVVGGVGLVISLISLHKLDVQWGGLLLLLLGLLLMIAEAFVPSFGALGLGGIVSFFIGSVFLFDKSVHGFQLPLEIIIPTVVILSVVTFGLAYIVFKTVKLKSKRDFEAMIGKKAKVVNVNKDLIQVEFDGETWTALFLEGIEVGDSVEVESFKGLKVKVKKIKES